MGDTNVTINPAGKVQGEILVPGDKSISHRALFVGALAGGKTRILHCLDAADCRATAKALEDLGVVIRWGTEAVEVEGREGKLAAPSGPLDMGNSGTTARLLLGLLAGQPFCATLQGDASLSARPMRRVTEPLEAMGARIEGPAGKDRLPLTIQGGALRGARHTLTVPSAQVKSALLFAGLYAKGSTTVIEPVPTRDHTERILKRFGADLRIEGSAITVEPGLGLKGQELRIPGDLSSAAFFLAAGAMVPGSSLTVRGVGLNPFRTGFLELLKRMGAKIEIVSPPPIRFDASNRIKTVGDRNDEGEKWEPAGDVTITHRPLKAITVERAMVPAVIDELPILLVAATQAHGVTVVQGAGELRVKETDRIHSMVAGLTALGARIRSEGETIVVEGPTPLKGARVDSFGDHRTAMALAVAALAAEGPTRVDGSEWVEISFPGFFHLLKQAARP